MIGPTKLPLDIIRNKRAKKYIIRLLPELVLRVTIPRGGSKREALRFVSENIRWIEKQFHSQRLHDALVPKEGLSNLIFTKGEKCRLNQHPMILNRSYSPAYTIPNNPFGEKYKLCCGTIPAELGQGGVTKRNQALGQAIWISTQAISIRNQKTRWGSCSNSGTISLNWRLIQLPLFVREYVILHELTHLEYLDHSPIVFGRAWPSSAQIIKLRSPG